MFIQNKWLCVYLHLVERGRSSREGYLEKHHVIPRSLGGSDNSDNITNLTAREHILAHLLLIRIVPKEQRGKMYAAARMMLVIGNGQNRIQVSSRTAALLKEQHANYCSRILKGRKLTDAQKQKIGDAHRGKIVSEESKARMRVSQQASVKSGKNALTKLHSKPRSKDHCDNLSKAKKGKPVPWLTSDNSELIKQKLRKPKSPTHIEAMRKPKRVVQCTVCGLSISANMFTRYHSKKCQQ